MVPIKFPVEPPPNITSSRDPAFLHPYLQQRWPILKYEYEALRRNTLILICTYRALAEQKRIFPIGRRGIEGERTITNCDGVLKKSLHNMWPSHAFDVGILVSGKYVGYGDEYAFLTPIADALQLIHGKKWNTLKHPYFDDPHFEVPKGIV